MRQENNYDSLLSATGDIINATGDFFNSHGDFFNVRGDVFNAKGDIFNAQGDVFNSRGDFFNADGPTGEPGSDDWMAWYDTHPFDSEYYAWLDGENNSPSGKGDKVFGFLNNMFDLADKGVDVFNKIKSGGTVEESGVNYDYKLGEQPQKDNTMWYVAGGAVVLLVVIGIVVARKKK